MTWLFVAALLCLVVVWFCTPTGTRDSLGEAAERVEPATQDASTKTPNRVPRTAASPSATSLRARLGERRLTDSRLTKEVRHG